MKHTKYFNIFGDTMNYPKVAIIILNYNSWKDTIECLESVLRNDYPNYQVIVIDNGSPNNSMEYIKAWAEGRQEVLTPEPSHPLYHFSHPPVKKPISYIYYTREEAEKGGNFELEEKLTREWQKQRKSNNKKLIPTSPYPLIFIQTGENLGFAGGNNVGMKYALKRDDFKYVWLLNNDTVIDQNTLTEMIKLAESNEEIGMVGAKLLFYENPRIIQSLGVKSNSKVKHKGTHIAMFEMDNLSWNKNIEINYFILGASLLVKKTILKKIGLLDEKYFMMTEEEDWCIRALSAGYKLFSCGKAKVWHKGSIASPSRTVKKTFLGKKSIRCLWENFLISGYYSVRNRIYFIKKNFPESFYKYCLIQLPCAVSRIILGILIYDDHKLDRIKLIFKALWDGLREKMGKTIDPLEWRNNLNKK